MVVVIQCLSAAANIMLPFGFTFGTFILFLWTLPMIIKFIKSLL